MTAAVPVFFSTIKVSLEQGEHLSYVHHSHTYSKHTHITLWERGLYGKYTYISRIKLPAKRVAFN